MKTNEPLAEEKKSGDTLLSFMKKHTALSITIAVVLLLCLATIVIVSMVHSAQAQEMEKTQYGKCYIETYETYSNKMTNVHYFTDDGVANLYIRYDSDGGVEYVSGSLGETTKDYSFDISIFGTLYLNYTHSNTRVVLNERNEIVEYIRPWYAISLEEAQELERKSYILYAARKCEHQFGDVVLIKKATCTNAGKESRTCKKCEFEEIKEISKLSHNYVNKICSVCGSKKTAEKADIEANTWYTYENGVLHVQNCLVAYASSISQGKRMDVQYHAVCQHCHAIDEASKPAGPEVNYEVQRIYNCGECGGQTIVRLKIS